MNKGKRPAQTGAEIVSDIVANKEKQMSRTRGNALYPKERNEVVDTTITRLISMEFAQMARFATSEQISLTNIDEVKKRTLIYLKACEENAYFPSTSGLARALGYSRQELDNWRSKKPGTDVGRWLNSFADACAEALHQAALKKNTSEIMTIFLSKALYGMKETQCIEIAQTDDGLHEIDEEALKAEYLRYAENGMDLSYLESEDNENDNENI